MWTLDSEDVTLDSDEATWDGYEHESEANHRPVRGLGIGIGIGMGLGIAMRTDDKATRRGVLSLLALALLS